MVKTILKWNNNEKEEAKRKTILASFSSTFFKNRHKIYYVRQIRGEECESNSRRRYGSP